jgi:Mor family transcriptional regulator
MSDEGMFGGANFDDGPLFEKKDQEQGQGYKEWSSRLSDQPEAPRQKSRQAIAKVMRTPRRNCSREEAQERKNGT